MRLEEAFPGVRADYYDGIPPPIYSVWLQSQPSDADWLSLVCDLCGTQSFEAAPFRGELMLFRRRFLDARRGGAERIRLVQAAAESVTTRPT